MTANETKLRSLIEGTRQYLVAFIQRPCSWGKSQWKFLWDDVQAQARELNDRGYYVGMVVTMAAPSGLESIGMYSPGSPTRYDVSPFVVYPGDNSSAPAET